METAGQFNGESYIEFLQQIMEEKGRLYTYRLPSYSPDFNTIEKLWKSTKREATHCKFFPTFEDMHLGAYTIR